MTPPFSSPGALRIPPGPPKNASRWSPKFNENLDTSWEPFFGQKVANMAHLGAQDGTQNASKMEPQIDRISEAISNPI